MCRSTWSLYVPQRRGKVSYDLFFGLWTRIFNFSFIFLCCVYSMKVYESCLPGSRKYDGQVSLVLIRLLASTTSFSGSTCYDLLFLFLAQLRKVLLRHVRPTHQSFLLLNHLWPVEVGPVLYVQKQSSVHSCIKSDWWQASRKRSMMKDCDLSFSYWPFLIVLDHCPTITQVV